MSPRTWLSLTLGSGLVAAWDSAPRASLPLPPSARRLLHRWSTAKRRQQPWSSAALTSGQRRIVEALADSLADAGTPLHRARRAVRATERLLAHATHVHDDGSVYVTTGDIPAMWLRDSAAQLAPLLALAEATPEIIDLARGLLRTQVEQVLIDPLANAFNPGPTGVAIHRDDPEQSAWVFERKYAVDTLCAPLALASRIWQASGSSEHVDARFVAAVRTILATWREGQQHDPDSYRLRRRFARREDSLSHGGVGAPVGRTGMTWSGFRPSDDACTYGYHVPSNAFAAVVLDDVGTLLVRAGGAGLAAQARSLSAEIRDGIAEHAIVEHPRHGLIYAYEVDGLGHARLLDDANIPSLLSLPYLGFCRTDDPVYAATRAWALSSDNPCWGQGTAVRGIGSTHTRRGWVWPLSIVAEGLTAATTSERESALRRVEASLTGAGIPESVHPSDPRRFSRRWFSWADMLYVELVMSSVDLTAARAWSMDGLRAAA